MIKYEVKFLDKLDYKSREKILFNIWKSRETNDPKLFKKLTENIWEFRTVFNKKQFRLFSFWVKKSGEMTLVIATHGIIKKTQKTPKKEIERAELLKKEYLGNN